MMDSIHRKYCTSDSIIGAMEEAVEWLKFNTLFPGTAHALNIVMEHEFNKVHGYEHSIVIYYHGDERNTP